MPRVGFKHSEETKKKISINNIKYWLGKKRLDISNGQMGNKNHMFGKFSGENNPKWKGGISKNKKYVSWRKNKRNRVIKRLKEEGSFHTWGEWETLKKQYNWTCPCCGKSEPEINLTEDHIVPLSKGGSDNIENIQPLCLSCNLKKHTKIIKY